MQIHHLRSATAIVSLGKHRLLIDPMLSEVGAFPGFKMIGGGRRRNPLVPLPPEATSALKEVTGVVITHEHPDHFDPAALAWVQEKSLPIWANNMDLKNLRRKGLSVQNIADGSIGFSVEVIPSKHGKGLVGWLMGPVAGYYMAHPGEPSVYFTGDSVLTDSVLEAIVRLKPDVIVAPAGTANMGFGGNILFSVDELVSLVKHSTGQVVFNHLEALDHCATSRTDLRARMEAEGLSERTCIPRDGQSLSFESKGQPHAPSPKVELSPGFQKWVSARFAGT